MAGCKAEVLQYGGVILETHHVQCVSCGAPDHTRLACGRRELQDERRKVDAATADAIEAVLDQLDACAAAERDFSLIVGEPPQWSPSFEAFGPLQGQVYSKSASSCAKGQSSLRRCALLLQMTWRGAAT